MHAIILNTAASVGVFSCFAMTLLIPSGYSLGPAFLLILAAVVHLKYRPQPVQISIWPLWLAALAVLLSPALSDLVQTGSMRELDFPSRWLLAVFAFSALIRVQPSEHFIWCGAILGSVGMLGLALIERENGIGRVELGNNPIQTGGLAVMAALVCLAAVFGSLFRCFQGRWNGFYGVCGTGATACALTTAMMTDSRGAFVGLAVGLLVLVFVLLRSGLMTQLLALFVCSTALMVLAFVGWSEQARFIHAWTNFISYFDGQVATSTGYRLELWRASWLQFLDAPLFGVGQEGYLQSKQALIDQGLVHPGIGQFGQVHNQYFDLLAKRGFFGVLSLLVMLGVIVNFASRHQSLAGKEGLALYLALASSIAASLGFMLTQAFVSHNSGATVLAFWSLVLLATLANKGSPPPLAAS